MRRFEFRAWDKKKRKMNYEIEEFYDGLGWSDYPTDVGSTFFCFLKSENQIVMQYTGMKDSEGKKIFEGDILKSTIGTKTLTGVLEWDADRAGWKQFLPRDRWKVIGNKWENKNLLEKK